MSDHPPCYHCKAPYAEHNWHRPLTGVCTVDGIIGVYWPQDEHGGEAATWDPRPVAPPLEQLLVNNIETLREVLDDWLSLADEDEPLPSDAPFDLIERAHTLRREIAELTGETDRHPAAY